MKQVYLERPEDMPKRFIEAWNSRDAKELASLFVEDAEFVNVVGLWWHNRKDIYKAHEYGLRVIFNNSKAFLGRVSSKFLSDDVALIHARMKLQGQTPHGSTDKPHNRNNIFSFVLTRSENGWSCVAAHNTDVVPGKETNLVDHEGNLRSVSYRIS